MTKSLCIAAAALALVAAGPVAAQTSADAQAETNASHPTDANNTTTAHDPVTDPSLQPRAGDETNTSTATIISAPAATDPGANQPVSATMPPAGSDQTVSNGPVPDTAANRAQYGGPMSRAGRATDASGN